jgi:hypothetical protein
MDSEFESEPDFDRARMELFFSLDATREIVRRSRVLLELSETDRPANDNEYDLTD